tara:strand:+ start:3371 stop:3838 length:468 start_codon:yes stop_codon:yes gene_type:complete
MRESYEESVGELKRVDHLYYVSLKYTRTVDVIISVLGRMINCFEHGAEALLKYAKENKLIGDIPDNYALRCEELRKAFPEDEELQDYINFFFFLRKVVRAKYTKREEFRRHVTMTATLNNGEVVEVNIDILKEYYDKTQDFVRYLKSKITDISDG